MSMEGRMTVCNLSIEMGARGGMIAPDQKPLTIFKGENLLPQALLGTKAMASIGNLSTDEGAQIDKEFHFDASEIEPMITYGTNPDGNGDHQRYSIIEAVEGGEATYKKSLAYMGYNEGDDMIGKPIDFVFLGSCTNGRIEDFRAFAEIIKGRRKADNVTAWLVPGSHKVLNAIKEEGILDQLHEAGLNYVNQAARHAWR